MSALARYPFAGPSCLGERPGPVPLSEISEHAEQVFVEMFDGAKLATDLYLPLGRRDRRPAILVRLPYDKAGEHAWIPAVAARLLADGYAVVAQDVRGKARSAGATLAFVHEAADGAATLDWIETQPWSDGRVGMFGQSYYGFTQWAAAATGHRALRCIVPQMTATDIAAEWMYRNGVFQLQSMAEWCAWAWSEPRLVVHDLDWLLLPVSSLLERWTGHANASYDAWLRHGPGSRYWASFWPESRRFGKVRAATLCAGGFWDVFQRGQVRDFHALRRERPRTRVQLWMAARDHFGSEWTPPGTFSPDYEADPRLMDEAVDRYLGPAPAWYRRWLGPDTWSERQPLVSIQIAGEGWRDSTTWPPLDARRIVLHPEPGGTLVARSLRVAHARLPYDPDEPVPSLDDNPWRTLFRPEDRAVLVRSDDVMTFDTPPLDRPLVLAGPARFRLTASSRGGAGALFATLVDLWPGGVARRLAGGAAAVGRSPATVTVDLGAVCCRLEAGRSLRLELAGSDFPRHPRPAGSGDATTASSLHPGELRLALGTAARLSISRVTPAD